MFSVFDGGEGERTHGHHDGAVGVRCSRRQGCVHRLVCCSGSCLSAWLFFVKLLYSWLSPLGRKYGVAAARVRLVFVKYGVAAARVRGWFL